MNTDQHITATEIVMAVASALSLLAVKSNVSEEDARYVHDALINKYSVAMLLKATGIAGHRTLLDRSVKVRYAAEIVAMGKEIEA